MYGAGMVSLDEVARVAMDLPEVTEGERYDTRTWSVAAARPLRGNGRSVRLTSDGSAALWAKLRCSNGSLIVSSISTTMGASSSTENWPR